MTSSDIAVVGAGPAGSAVAWRLARSGARVTLFDASHPREKPCGGGLTGRALAIVGDMLDGGIVDGVTVRGLRFGSGAAGAGRVATVPLGASATLVVVSRKALDQALLSSAVRAGARLVAERVTSVSVDGRRATVTTTAGRYSAAAVVGADGATSLVRRRLLEPFTPEQLSTATGYFVPGVSFDEAVIRSFGDPPGYLWSFPRPDHLAVGICAPSTCVRGVAGLRRIVLGWLEQARLPSGAGVRPYSWPIPSLGFNHFDRLRVAGDRWMLVGDAAGLVDPLTREGLFYALHSGVLAAEAWLADAATDAYAERLRDDVVPELARAAALQAGFFSSRFSDLLVEALDRSGAVRRIMGDLVAGRQSYGSLPWRLLSTFEMGLAWRLLRLFLRGMVDVTGRAPAIAVE
jgi:geranylgeranyl reductase family protein